MLLPELQIYKINMISLKRVAISLYQQRKQHQDIIVWPAHTITNRNGMSQKSRF